MPSGSSRSLQDLMQALDGLAEGTMATLPEEIVRQLRRVWPEITGSAETGMKVPKLAADRIESATWNRPVLTFVIERHGATVLGSTRAEVHSWVLDLDSGTAHVKVEGQRQVRKPQPKLDTVGLGREVVAAIVNRLDAPYLQWSADREQVSIRIGLLIPDKGPRETTARRRKRLDGALESALAEGGWRRVLGTRPHTYRR